MKNIHPGQNIEGRIENTLELLAAQTVQTAHCEFLHEYMDSKGPFFLKNRVLNKKNPLNSRRRCTLSFFQFKRFFASFEACCAPLSFLSSVVLSSHVRTP